MDIRLIKENELEKLLALYTHLHENDLPLPKAIEVKQTWTKIIENDCLSIFGLFIDDNLLSSCYLSVIPNLTRSCSPFAVVENVVTHTAHRNRGYGKAILRHTLDTAWQKGCYKVMLLTGRNSDRIFKFYESVGFNRDAKQAFVIKRGI